MVGEVVGHMIGLEDLHVALADDSGGKGSRGMEQEFVDKGDLAGEDDGHKGSGVEFGLGDGVELVENVESEEMSLVDEEHGDLLSGDDV